jgi:putative nucleotidyltransferase with HDIG domain
MSDSPSQSGQRDRWRRRPMLAVLVGAGVFAVPVACSIGVSALTAGLLGRATTVWDLVRWWTIVIGAATLTFLVAERACQRALPLRALLQMGMLFPGRAPRRLAVARRAASTRDLARQLEAARSAGLTDEPTVAAERIVTLAASLSAHDRSTRGHSERVRALTDLVASELGLSAGDCERLRWSALLHDIGKLAVHPDVLNKSGVLSEEEWQLMRQHPIEGARIAAPLAGWLGEWVNTIVEHHERYDGTGYPHGVAGHEISLGGRIVAVADSYDVMTSCRSYSHPKSPEAARAELAACAGSQFDPVIVRTFLSVSTRRLRAVAPLGWLGSLPFANFVPAATGLATQGARIGTSALVAASGVVGIAALRPTHTDSHTTRPAVVASRPTSPSGRPDNGIRFSITPAPAPRGPSAQPGPSTSIQPGAPGSNPSPAQTIVPAAPTTVSPPLDPTPSTVTTTGSTGLQNTTTTATVPISTPTTSPGPNPTTSTTTGPPPTTTTTTTPALCLLGIICL